MTTGRITANLPSRDFDQTEGFYARLGFKKTYRDDGWMILVRDGMQVEFFPHPELDHRSSWFSACLRLPDIAPVLDAWSSLDLPRDPAAIPRITDIMPARGPVPAMFAMIDPDGSLWRVIEEKADA
ncbi:bleomycin resistance protein [Lutimaribacter marinistellae]|uniref:Bleomycin resistance protein n=1 Tax=Lutimaribacter marinistellae TaxID=1820329 RepID=A0ABV7TJ56_9RHOB